tara:strand:+ start:300 stop:1016 length:717 start_codon:yes stop_codon:yes gene_type:complete
MRDADFLLRFGFWESAMLSLVIGALSLSTGVSSLSRRDASLLGALSTSTPWLLGGNAAGAAATAVSSGAVAKLSDGSSFPLASFGLQVYDDATAEKLTTLALQEGYRNFFASVLAGNQRGFARAVKASGIPRAELFICGSVVSNRAQGYDAALKATQRGCQANLEAFAAGDIKYLDMIMLDYPGGDCDSIRGQWAAFEEMVAAGTARTLAVSNFSPAQLDCVLEKAKANHKPLPSPSA